ncbi:MULTISPECIES: caspase, EACC1-associated type [unclassified Tolypothrix]|uniref:caspase, EACC1-associated type n=1 Tax=unclassified Tolypothrix TaxID=2649714 RepID=UPI0005EAC116|nr:MULTISPECIES: GUN4 domain-containing protein [unclassified Tolypothrix]BAY90413.1 extracellular ligand-binding receptor [Microchaete diplosiphon NIES-3275]EKF01055.1 ICE-like protease p20 domain protein [Tolypothrix sp. PCC 7601]MBE9086429.1 GUN4 domain-containing protein [Tolypothrix sp. LEGE 11397]UYD24586.1 GUN4 domain-containing protein [Tolypothrix sp. PCC 7712]UYD33185.1 GUN4 domain-containing protein [Tolypothrix sp. PCC 7601]
MAKYALLIGASEYESQKINNLSGVVKDIEAMQRVLQNSGIGGFDEVKFLSNPDSDTMRSEIEQLFMEKCQKDDVVLLYFSGHGYRHEDGSLFFISRNTQVNPQGFPRIGTAVDAKFIHQNYMSRSKSKRQVLILDCCFSGAFAERMSAKDIANLSIKNEIGEQLGGEGRAVLTSSTATQQSFEDSGGGVYTRYLVEGIEKGAADSDNDGVITVAELHEYAKRKVQEAKPAMKPEIFAVKEGYTIRLAKAPVDDPQLEYRKEVEQCVIDSEISELGRFILDLRQTELGLTSEKAKEIENEVLKPFREFQESLQKYEKALTAVLQKQQNLSDSNLKLLKRLQQVLKLRDEDVAAIHNFLILSSEKGVYYTKLRDLLAAGNWKDADMETYRVMIQALGKKEGDYFKDEELLNFPCTDLRTIDRLWVKYSNGHFGFSVQKEIYLSVGGKLDGTYDDEAWNQFRDRVGWRVESSWISYTHVTFSTSAPRAHLPVVFGEEGERLRVRGYLVYWSAGLVFSRIETCKL